MKVSEKFRSKYLNSGDIHGDKTVVITRVEEEEVGAKKEEKVVVYFKGVPRGMILNATNAKRLIRAFGDDSDAWLGRTITLCLEPTSYGGDECDGLRVRVGQVPLAPQVKLADDSDEASPI